MKKTNILLTPAIRSAETLRTRFEINNLLCLALGATFFGTGIAKVVTVDFVLETFQGSNLAPGLLGAIGLLEILAATLTIIPTTRLLGSGLISLIMTGAIAYHMMRAEWMLVTIPVAALAMALSSLLLELSLRKAEPAPASTYAS
jgi:hypothetical protein